MKKATLLQLDAAVDFIKQHKYVCAVWVSPGCPACEHQIPLMEAVVQDPWDIILIDADSSEDYIKLFGYENYPITFIYKNGERLLMRDGVAPKEAIRETLDAVLDDNFKTNKELEKEMLESL